MDFNPNYKPSSNPHVDAAINSVMEKIVGKMKALDEHPLLAGNFRKPKPPQDLRTDRNISDELLDRIVPHATKRCHEPRTTKAGSPCAKSWDAEWIAKVDEAEAKAGHRICGARTMCGTPCNLDPNHTNGRCRYHGGFDLTGAEPGNRNAVIHGLYSRRLRVCGRECPMWHECPCAGDDVMRLPAKQRPTCPYEQTEYNTALTDALASGARNRIISQDPFTRHIAHNVALLQVMVNRASVSLRNSSLMDEQMTAHNSVETRTTKMSAYLQAYLRLTSELRQFIRLLQPQEKVNPSVADHLDQTCHAIADTSLDPDKAELLHADSLGAMDPTQRKMREAIEAAYAGDPKASVDAFQPAVYRMDKIKDATDVPLNGALYPVNNGVAEESVRILVEQMTLDQRLKDRLAERAKMAAGKK